MRVTTITANVNVTAGSDVGDLHHAICSPASVAEYMNGKPRKFDTMINMISVTPSVKKRPPVFQSIVLLIIPFTKSNTHSMKFCIPVGRRAKLRVPITAIKKTITAATVTIITDDKSNVKPRNSTNLPCSTSNSPLFPALIL